MTMKSIWLGCTAMAVATVGALPVPSASAQGVNEIVVTARQRSESVVDVPGTVNVLTQDTIKRAGVERAEDFINLTAGVTMVNAAEVGDTQVNIRGINGARDAENSFAFIIDGILYSNPSAFNREFSDLQQIEVFKGPQGAIYGRNAAAGAIIVTTTKPGNEFEAHMKASAGNNNSYFAQAMMGGAIVEDELFFRLSGDWRTTDGFYTNSFLGKDDVVDNFENFNINGRLMWEPNPSLSVDLRARYGEVNAASITFNSAFALPAFGPEAFEDVNKHNFLFQGNVNPSNDQESLELSGKFDFDMDWATLTGWALYSDIDQNFLSDGTSAGFGFFATEANCVASSAALAGFPLPAPTFNSGNPAPFLVDPTGSFLGAYTPLTCDGYQFQVRDQEDVSFEFRLTSPDDQSLRWQIGTYFLDIDRTVGVATLIDPSLGLDPALGTALIPSLVNPLTESLVHDNFESRVYAVFGSVQYDVTEDVEASFALRYDREKRKVDNLIDPTARSTFIGLNLPTDAFLNPGLDPFLNPNLAPDGSIPNQEKTFEQIQPKVSLTWDVAENLTLFASWGIGFKSGGFNNQGSAATVDIFINGLNGTIGTPAAVVIEDVFDKETSSAFEWGFKGNVMDGQVTVEGAGYFTKVDDMQFFEFFVGPFGLLRVVNNIDEVTIWGGELAVNAALTDVLSVYANGNVTKSKIDKNVSRPDTVGNEAPYTPDFTLNVGAQVVQPIYNGNLNLVGRLDFQYVGDTWFHTVQSQTRPTIFSAFAGFDIIGDYTNTQRDAYHTLNLRVGVEGERWSVTGFAQNLTNEKILEEVIPAPEFGGSFLAPGARRAWGFEVTFDF